MFTMPADLPSKPTLFWNIDVIPCRNVPVAEIAENDGHQQAQPLLWHLFIVLTLLKKKFIWHWCSMLWHRQNNYRWPNLMYLDLQTILQATHSNYLTQKLCYSGDKFKYMWQASIIWHIIFFIQGQVCKWLVIKFYSNSFIWHPLLYWGFKIIFVQTGHHRIQLRKCWQWWRVKKLCICTNKQMDLIYWSHVHR